MLLGNSCIASGKKPGVRALVSALPFVEYLDIIENSFGGFFPGLEPLQVDHFVLDRTEECFAQAYCGLEWGTLASFR